MSLLISPKFKKSLATEKLSLTCIIAVFRIFQQNVYDIENTEIISNKILNKKGIYQFFPLYSGSQTTIAPILGEFVVLPLAHSQKVNHK